MQIYTDEEHERLYVLVSNISHLFDVIAAMQHVGPSASIPGDKLTEVSETLRQWQRDTFEEYNALTDKRHIAEGEGQVHEITPEPGQSQAQAVGAFLADMMRRFEEDDE